MTDCFSQVPPGIQKSRNQMSKGFTGCHKKHLNVSSSSGGNESHNLNVQALGDRLQSETKEDGTQADSELGDEGGRKPQTNFQVNTAALCIVARECILASFQMSRSVETCTRGCQNNSFSNAQDILNILIGSLLKMSRTTNQFLCATKNMFQTQI